MKSFFIQYLQGADMVSRSAKVVLHIPNKFVIGYFRCYDDKDYVIDIKHKRFYVGQDDIKLCLDSLSNKHVCERMEEVELSDEVIASLEETGKKWKEASKLFSSADNHFAFFIGDMIKETYRRLK